MIVIYTADVERSETSDLLDAGCLKLETQSVFLSEMNPEEISRRLYQKVTDRIPLSEEELMEFIILPLTYRGKDEKNKSIGQSAGENDYMEAELTAATASILTDQDPQTHTFQGTGKTLGSVFAQGIGNRAQYDGFGEDQAQIIFNDEFGIEIWSTGDIHIEATDGGKVSIQSVGQDFEGMDALKNAFEQMYQFGNDKYVADGGADMGFDALGLIRSRNLD